MATFHVNCYETLEQKKNLRDKIKIHKNKLLSYHVCQHKSKKQQIEIQIMVRKSD